MTDRESVLARWARALASSAPGQPLPMRLCLASARLLGADGGAITLAYTEAERVTLCVTDQVAGRLEDLQDVLGQGPASEAYVSGELTIAALDSSDPAGRWPMFTEAARAAVGRPTLYAWPIRPENEVVGVLTLYQVTPRPLRYSRDHAQFLADALGAALLRDPDSQAELPPGPWSARAQVHQAVGFVIAQLEVGPDDALALLRAHAYAHDTTVDDIAAQVVRRDLDFSQADPVTGRNDRNENR